MMAEVVTFIPGVSRTQKERPSPITGIKKLKIPAGDIAVIITPASTARIGALTAVTIRPARAAVHTKRAVSVTTPSQRRLPILLIGVAA